jgi:hypothetical protein
MGREVFYPAIPAIAQAYQNDPRTRLAQQALDAGGSTAPTAGGKWAWASGLGRIGSGIVGAIEQKQNQRWYDDKQQQVMNEVAAALGGGAAGPGAGAGGHVDTNPAAGGTPVQPPVAPPVPQIAQNNLPPQNPPMAPQAPLGSGGATALPAAAPGAPAAPQGAPMGAPGFDALGQGAPHAPAPGRNYNVADAVAELGMTPEAAQAQYGHVASALAPGGAAPSAAPFTRGPGTPAGVQLINAMLPITRATESKGQDLDGNGKPLTSPVGARYAMQVMPATARKPGFGITPARNDSPDEYNRVGTELLQKLTEKYGGDASKAWAAYNAGTGRLDHAIAKHGDAWLDHMPAETRNYVAKNMAALGGAGTQQASGGAPDMNAAPMTAQLEALPATNAPPIPGLPDAPQDRGAVQSLALSGAQRLLASKDPFLYQQAMEMLGRGQTEQNDANQKARDVLNSRDNFLYQAGVGDHFDATQAQRNDAYTTGRELRGYAHEDNTNSQNRAFTHNERVGEEQFTAGENQKNRDAEWQRTKYTVDGRTQAEAEKRAAKMQMFFQTPQGAKLYGDSTKAINQNNGLAGLVDNFMSENSKYQDTGGMVLNNSFGSGISRTLNGNLQTMDSITHQLAPMIRQQGQGSMSDRDLEMFERAIPSIGNNYDTNVKRAGQFKQYVSRMNDFEAHKLEAAANGSNVDFLKSWEAFRNAVPVSSGKSYEEWVSSIPHYDANGNKK